MLLGCGAAPVYQDRNWFGDPAAALSTTLGISLVIQATISSWVVRC
jgi:hypothetical protein